MPYQATKRTVERVKHALDEMLISEKDIAFPTDAPHKLAFRIHNAIAICPQFPEYRKYNSLKIKFIVRVRPGKVVCERRGVDRDYSPAAIIHEQSAKMSFDEIETVEGIVGAMLSNRIDEGYFPGAVLADAELRLLYNWTSKNGYYIIDNESAGVTVTKENTGLDYKPVVE